MYPKDLEQAGIFMCSSMKFIKHIKVLDPSSKRVESLAGMGKAGFRDGSAPKAQLSEPSGIVEVGNGKLLVADTNNNAIRYLDLNQGELRTLELKGVQPPASKVKTLKRLRRRLPADTQIVTVDGGSSNEGNLLLKISVPSGYHLSKEARSKVIAEAGDAIVIEPLEGNLSPNGSAALHFKRDSPSALSGRINCKVYYCKEDEVCLYQSIAFEVAFKEVIPDSAPAQISLEYVVKPRISEGSLQLPAAS